MRNTFNFGSILIVGVLLITTGCATKAPTISHAHIGHVVDGWESTPGQKGLIEAAQIYAQTSAEAAERASQSDATLESRKWNVKLLVHASHPDYFSESKAGDGKAPGMEFGVRTTVVEASRHLEFSADSDDASNNVRQESSLFSINAQAVLDRCDLIAALGMDAMNVDSVEEINLITAELVGLTKANLYGEDLNGDGIIGGPNADEYGLEQLRVQVRDMIARESPAYTTVDRWYLFNLIRLPSGKWTFGGNSSGKKGGGSY